MISCAQKVLVLMLLSGRCDGAQNTNALLVPVAWMSARICGQQP
jgi:hypothetical protein